jgi:hypothetical protein
MVAEVEVEVMVAEVAILVADILPAAGFAAVDFTDATSIASVSSDRSPMAATTLTTTGITMTAAI